MAAAGLQHRGARLAVPKAELRQIHAARVLQRLDKIVGGHRLAVMPVKVEVGALAEARRAQEAVQHAHHLGALLIDGGSVEVVDFYVGGRAHWMGHGAGVLRELDAAQKGDIADPADACRAQVRGELLVAEDGEALLQAQLEPVAAGDPVAGPVVEVFVRHHGFHPLVGGVRGGVRMGQDAGGVEDVEALVLHGAHVEGVHRDNHEGVQVVFAAIGLLVPAHGMLQGGHGIVKFVQIVRLCVEPQRHLAAIHGGEGVLQALQVARHGREEIGGLLEGVLPGDPVAAAFLPPVHVVAAGKQDWEAPLVRAEGGGEPGHDIRPVQIPGDVAEAFGLALGAEDVPGLVEALQRGVVLGADFHLGGEFKGVRHAVDDQPLLRQAVFVGGEFATIQSQAAGGKAGAAVQPEVSGPGPRRRVAAHLQAGADQGPVLVDVQAQAGLLDEEGGRLVVLEAGGFGLAFFHGRILHHGRRLPALEWRHD